MAKGVRRVNQISVKMSGRKERNPDYVGKLQPRIFNSDIKWRRKNPGAGLDDYVLDLMKLE